MTGQDLYDWLESALEMGKPTCQVHRKTKLQLVWITDEAGDLITWHFECKRCNREYKLIVGWQYLQIGDED